MDIKSINNDSFLKTLDYKELSQVSNDIREFLIDSISKTGGHLASNLGDVELIMSLHMVFDCNKDKILFDVGHQAYTHKILNGKANEFENLRKTNGLSGFVSRNEDSKDVYEAGHSSTSISTAMGMAIARDASNDNYEIIAFIGDGSISNGVAMEALNEISTLNHKVIIVLNDNDMTITKTVGQITKNESYFNSLGINYLGPVDGHNIEELVNTFNIAKNYKESVLVHVKTIKGKGYSFAENDKTGKFHSISAFNKENAEVLNQNQTNFTKEISYVVKDIIKNDKDTYLVCPTTSYSGNYLDLFNEVPDRTIEVGIAEEHTMLIANGLALNHKKPYISIYSTFMQRGYDYIVNDICRINSNVTFLVDRAGVVSEDGKTHQGNLDVSFIYPLEYGVITNVSATRYIKPLLECLANYDGTKFIRFQKHTCNKEDYVNKVEFGKFIYEVYDSNNKDTIIAVGESCEELRKIIIKDKLNINLINPIFIKPLDYECLDKIANTNIFVYDNTSVFNGFSSAILDYYNGKNVNVKFFTLPNRYIEIGQYDDLLLKLGLDVNTILNKVKYGK